MNIHSIWDLMHVCVQQFGKLHKHLVFVAPASKAPHRGSLLSPSSFRPYVCPSVANSFCWATFIPWNSGCSSHEMWKKIEILYFIAIHDRFSALFIYTDYSFYFVCFFFTFYSRQLIACCVGICIVIIFLYQSKTNLLIFFLMWTDCFCSDIWIFLFIEPEAQPSPAASHKTLFIGLGVGGGVLLILVVGLAVGICVMNNRKSKSAM